MSGSFRYDNGGGSGYGGYGNGNGSGNRGGNGNGPRGRSGRRQDSRSQSRPGPSRTIMDMLTGGTNSGTIKTCANCKRQGHEVKVCVGPVDQNGFIRACPACNETHSFNECPNKGHNVSMSTVKFFLVTTRAGKPLISFPGDIRNFDFFKDTNSQKYPWTPKGAVAYQNAFPNYWRDFQYADKPQDDPVSMDPA